MNMQHNGFQGRPVANFAGERIADRARRMNESRLDEAALVALNSRINAAETPWFVLRVWTGREQHVEKCLEQVGISALVPLRKGPDLRRRHRIIEGAMMPVVHGYVLVQMLPVAEYLAAIATVDHAIEVLGGYVKPVWIPNVEVSRFNSLAQRGAYDWERPVELVVKAGDEVLITDGHFSGRQAVVTTPNRHKHGDVVVEARLMGRTVPVTVPLAMLEKL